MTTANTHGQGAEQSSAHTAVPPFSELLLRMGTHLRATLLVDGHGRLAWMDPTLAPLRERKGVSYVGRAAEELLGHLPWLLKALGTALTGKPAVGTSHGVSALALPLFGDEGELLGAAAHLSTSEPECPSPALHEHLEQELLRVQRQHEEFINSIDGIVWQATADFRFSFVSQQAERLLGYPPQRWTQEPDFWRSHLHPEDREWAPTFCMKATRECRPHELEYRMVAADGRTVWLRDIVTVITENGRPLQLRGVMVDVTEQHRDREHLEHTLSLLRATLDSTADGVLVTDLNQNITAFNRRYQELWRLPDGLLTDRGGTRVLESVLVQFQYPEQLLARIQELYEAPELEGFDTLELRDGRIIERYSRPQRMGDTIIGRVWSFRDVTQRVLAQQERDRLLVAERTARERMEESFALLDTFLNNAPIGLGFIDRDLRFIRLNEALAALHGRRREEEIGRTVREMTPHVAPTIEPLMRRVLETGEPIIGFDLVGEVPSTLGRMRYWKVSYYPVQTPSGGIVGLGAVVVEVTAERLAQQERERLLREAHEAIHIRDDFLSIASHELKTPLTPLKLHLRLLEQKSASGLPVPPPLVRKALTQVGRLSGLISDLLDASHVEAGQLSVEREPVPLLELVREVLADFRPSCHHHTLEYEKCAEELVVLADRGRLTQVLTNLLENALKYSPLGGPIHVAVTRAGTEARVSVSDRGIGIPEDQQPHLFERFFRARNAPISGFGGLGLGLFICRDIIERHGGRIWVESEVGQGSTFHFTLPLAAPTESPGEP